MKRLIALLLPLLFIVSRETDASTWPVAPPGNPSDILNVITASTTLPGDTIQLDQGIYNWDDNLVITAAQTKAITLAGAGSGLTTVNLAVVSGPAIDWTVKAGSGGSQAVTRIRDIAFRQGSKGLTGVYMTFGAAGWNGDSYTPGDNSRLVVSDCIFDVLGQIHTPNVLGVFTHCDFFFKSNNSIFHSGQIKWNGGNFGHYSASDAVTWNSDEFLYVEDCNGYGDGVARETGSSIRISSGPFTDAEEAGRVVFRHNKFYHTFLSSHGLDTGSEPQGSHGVLAAAQYYNDFYDLAGVMVEDRNGLQICHHNTLHIPNSTTPYNPQVKTAYYRSWSTYKTYDMADGYSIYDNNEGGATPTLFFEGQASIASTATGAGGRVTVSGTPWSPHDFQNGNYTVRNKDINLGHLPGLPRWAGPIGDNGNNWIDYHTNNLGAPPLVFAAGEHIEVVRVNHAMDEAGYHGGQRLVGWPPAINSPGLNSQTLYHNYYWNNVVVNDGAPGGPAVVANVGVGNNQDYLQRIGTVGDPITGGYELLEGTPPSEYYPQDFAYPHPLSPYAATDPRISSGSTVTFSSGVTPACGAVKANCFQVTTANFTGTPTFAVIAGTLPANVTLNTSSGVLSGSASGASGDYTFTIRATSGAQTATQAFVLKVITPNNPPTIMLNTPTDGQAFLSTATIVFSSTPTDTDGTIASVSYYRGGSTLIGAAVTAPPWSLSSLLPAGSYSITAKATDNTGLVSTASNARSITVTTPVGGTPTPATISIKAGPGQ